MKEQKQYTFEEWLNNQFWHEKDYLGNSVYNDSENYLHLVSMGKMTYEVLNKIQDEQSKAYEYMIKKSLETNESFFKKDTINSLDLQKVIDIKIEKIEKHIKDNNELYYDIILPRLHRGIKVGAKFITPEQYKAYSNNELLDVFIKSEIAPYMIYDGYNPVCIPTDEQMKYAQMEVQVLWLKKLQEYKRSFNMNGNNHYEFDESFIFFYSLPIGNIIPSQNALHDDQKQRNFRKHLHYMNCNAFKNSIKELTPDAIKPELEFHLRDYVRKGGNATDWINETKNHLHYELTPKQKDGFLTALEDMQPAKDVSIYTHREIIIAHKFKVKAGIENEKTPAQWKDERNEKARQAYYTTIRQSENYKPPTEKELKNIIQILHDSPEAQTLAITEIETLQKL